MAGVLHVFIETNWVVAYGAPAHQKVPAAIDLLKKANDGVIQLHLPSVCITECRRPLVKNSKSGPKLTACADFFSRAKQQNIINPKTDEVVRQTLDRMESLIKERPRQTGGPLIGSAKGDRIGNLWDGSMLGRSAELSNLGLQPFDQALSGVHLRKGRNAPEKLAFNGSLSVRRIPTCSLGIGAATPKSL